MCHIRTSDLSEFWDILCTLMPFIAFYILLVVASLLHSLFALIFDSLECLRQIAEKDDLSTFILF